MAIQWYYPGNEPDTSFDDGQSGDSWQPHNFCYGAAVTLPTGNVTQLGVFCDTQLTGDVGIKLGLYNSGGTLVVQGSGTVPDSIARIWRSFDVTDTPITAGTYYVVCVGTTTKLRYGYDSSGNGVFVNQNYAASMGSSVTIDGPETGQRYGMRAEVDDSGSGPGSGSDSAKAGLGDESTNLIRVNIIEETS